MKYLEDWYGSQAIDYLEAWELQRAIHAERAADSAPDTTMLLEHPAVYTAGRRTLAHERPIDGAPVVDVDRGGKITFHGPGQLVGYPIVKLPPHVLVVDHVRRVEEALIRAFTSLDVPTGRVKGRSGVWLAADEKAGERKIAAIGIRVARGVTMHGFSVNCDVDMKYFDVIVACGIADASVTNLSHELGRHITPRDFAEVLKPHLEELMSWQDYLPSPDIERPAVAPELITGVSR